MELKGLVNLYVHRLITPPGQAHVFSTVLLNSGVTPALTRCVHPECDGAARGARYDLLGSMQMCNARSVSASYGWYRPALPLVEDLPWLLKGGLLVAPLEEAMRLRVTDDFSPRKNVAAAWAAELERLGWSITHDSDASS